MLKKCKKCLQHSIRARWRWENNDRYFV